MPAAATPDYVDGLIDRALAEPDATVRDVVLALKDRIVAEPVIDTVVADESALLEALFGAPLDTPVTGVPDLEDHTRRYCGVLLLEPAVPARRPRDRRGGGRPEAERPGADADACGSSWPGQSPGRGRATS